MSENTNGTTIGKFGYKQELKRTLSFKDLLVYGLIFMVGLAEIVLRTIFLPLTPRFPSQAFHFALYNIQLICLMYALFSP
ncbi:hypothetical protein [Lentibacillus juripiscarius]|uniref:Uncharacterized protein n=1 Tax=Lentibacillus juripiscarius TaxID=257446 RepID=A0ABW5V8E2_9BACI